MTNLASKTPPDIIYHYTTIGGLKGIIENKNIWATNINHLNDWKEFKEFVNPFLNEFRETKTKERLEEIFNNNSQLIYVCSFSQKEDDLSQWRAYGANANGFSIGFSYSKLKGTLPSGDELFGLYKCKYNKKDRETEISDVVNRNAKSDPPNANDFIRTITKLTTLAPCYKNIAFKDEEEWRLVKFVKDETIKFREAKTMIIPYVEIKLDKDDSLSIKSICIGPTPYMSESELSLKLFLQENGLSKVKIKKSLIPYRNL